MTETIYALATAPGRAAVAVVRLTGPDTARAVRALAGRLPRPREARLRRLRDPGGRTLDQALVLWFPAPRSYTGEDAAELHLHGGTAVVAGVLTALAALGLRGAGPGDFTRRAFEHGKLDLAQAEAVADLVDAQTEAQARQALAQAAGALGRAHEAWRGALVEVLARLEAAVDFPDEDLPADVAAAARAPLEAVRADVVRGLEGVRRGVRVREGYRLALMGAPNSGKSTLFNALARRDLAIVTDIPGTTRDVLETTLNLGGHAVHVADTAGLRESADPIEAEGIRRARAWGAEADLRLWLVDGAGRAASPPPDLRAGDFCVINKADLPSGDATSRALTEARALELEVHRLSALDPDQVDLLLHALGDRVTDALSGDEPAAGARLRQAERLEEALQHLDRALQRTDQPELAAEDVRLAGRVLDRIVGKIGAEDVLDRVFSSFCIGK